MINRCDEKRQQRAAKVLTGCLELPEAQEWMYTNDARLLAPRFQAYLPRISEI